MDYGTPEKLDNQGRSEAGIVLEEVILQGATQMLQTAIENEVVEYIEKHKHMADETGHRLVTRNGHLPGREIVTGIGPVDVQQPRVRDERPEENFTSSILPPYMRRLPSIDALIPALYLRGISTGDFKEALEAILGPNATGLSATNIVRLKEVWKEG